MMGHSHGSDDWLAEIRATPLRFEARDRGPGNPQRYVVIDTANNEIVAEHGSQAGAIREALRREAEARP